MRARAGTGIMGMSDFGHVQLLKQLEDPSGEGLPSGPRGCEGLEKTIIVTGVAASPLIMDKVRASRMRSSSSTRALSPFRNP